LTFDRENTKLAHYPHGKVAILIFTTIQASAYISANCREREIYELWAQGLKEFISCIYFQLKMENTKFEYRKPKQIRKLNDQMFKTMKTKAQSLIIIKH
jgi:hypothetical protein